MEESRLSATHLQRIIAAILEDTHATTELRNECHRLMMAIGTNNRREISESVSQVEHLAALAGVVLPAAEPE